MHLLDTDTLSALLWRRRPEQLVTRLRAVPRSERFTSSISLGELYYGAYRLPDQLEIRLARIRSLGLTPTMVLPFDAQAAERYAQVRVELERRGQPLAEADLRITAIALARGLVLVTGNVRHFARVPGLTVENWLEP